MSLRLQVRDAVRSVALGSGATALLKLAQLVVLGRLLSASDFGVMTMATVAIGLFANLAEIGAGSVVVHRQSMSRRELDALFWIGLTIGVLGLGILMAASGVIAAHFSEPRLVEVLAVAGLQLPLNAFITPYRSLLERDLAFRTIATIESVSAAVGVATAISMAMTGVGLLSLPAGVASSSGCSALLFFLAGRANWTPGLSFSHESLAGSFRFGTALAGQRLLNYLTSNADYLLVGSVLGSKALGLYTIAYTLANLPSSHVNSLLNRVSFPALARIQTDLPRTRDAYLRLQRISSLVNAPLMGLMAAAAPIGLPLLLGAEWIPAVPLLQILCIVGLARSIAGTVGPLLLAQGRPDLGLRWAALVVVIQLPCLYAGVTFGGAVGVTLGFATSQLLLLWLNYLLLVRTLIGPCGGPYAAAVAWPILFAAAGGGVIAAVAWLPIPDLPKLVLAVIAGSATYALSIWLLRPDVVRDFIHLLKSRP